MQEQSSSLSLAAQRALGQTTTAGKQAKQQVHEQWKLPDYRFRGIIKIKKKRERKKGTQGARETVSRVTFLGVAEAVEDI